MVLLAELLLGAGILVAVYLLAVGRTPVMTFVEPDVVPGRLSEGPVTGPELAGLRLPLGVGYRKVDVDRLLERLRRQLEPEAAGMSEPEATQPEANGVSESPTVPHEPVRDAERTDG